MGAYLILQLAAITRVTAGVLPDAWYRTAILVSGVMWILAFGAFVVRYGPMLLKARVDGKPG